jgi:hypothetical protein
MISTITAFFIAFTAYCVGAFLVWVFFVRPLRSHLDEKSAYTSFLLNKVKALRRDLRVQIGYTKFFESAATAYSKQLVKKVGKYGK